MPLQISIKWPILIANAVVFLFFSTVIIVTTYDLPAKGAYIKPITPPTTQPQQSELEKKAFEFANNIIVSDVVVSGLPLRLKIPKIKVDAVVVNVGLTPEGAMGAPKNYRDVAWFELGQRPGENGNAVIAGHYGWKDNKPSAFDNLYKLRKGDKIYVEDDKGVTVTFVVNKAVRYSPNDLATEVFVSSDGKSHLNLITCEGIWNKLAKSYSKRLVIFADKE